MYEASLTCKSKIPTIKHIKQKLNAVRFELFKTTCFGNWLDLTDRSADPVLVHTFLQLETFPENAEPETLYFKLGNLPPFRYGSEEFSLITGLHFGESPALRSVLGDESAINRIFGNQRLEVKEVHRVFGTLGTLDDHLSNEDAIRVCLWVMIDRFFLGREGPLHVANTLLLTVDDLQSWNQYPWGSYVWAATYNQMHRAIGKHRGDLRSKMTITGFFYSHSRLVK